MADYSYSLPAGQPENFMVGTLDAPGNGTTAPTYAIVSGNTNNSFKIGSYDGVLEVNVDTYDEESYPMTLGINRTDDAGTLGYTVQIDIVGLLQTKTPTIYVDPVNGKNSYPGTMSFPVSSLDVAFLRVMGGGAVLLYTGNYGSRSFGTKPCTIKGLSGNTPVLSSVELLDGFSYVLDTLTFSTEGVQAVNGSGNRIGSIMIRNCDFGGSNAIIITSYLYVSILRNTVHSTNIGVSLSDVEEATIMSNTIYGDGYPTNFGLVTNGVTRMEFAHNTVDSVGELNIDDVGSVASYGVLFVPVTPALIISKTIGPFPYPFVTDGLGNYAVAINLTTGSACDYGVDFTVTGGDTVSILSGSVDPLNPYLGDAMEVGDYLRVQYELQGTAGVPGYSNLDSNFFTNVNTVNFTSGLLANVRYNNVYNTADMALFVGILGNRDDDPLFVGSGDYNLTDPSPSRKTANPSTSYTSNKIAPYPQSQDRVGANRAYKGEGSDIGALENLSDVNGRTEAELNLGQQGYDVVYDGDSDRPLRRLSKAMSDVSSDPVQFDLGSTTAKVSDRKMYFDDHGLELNSASVSVSNPQAATPYVLKRDSAFVQPFDQAAFEGVSAYVAMDGSDTDGNGSFAAPYRTIDKALSTIATVIFVMAGSYPLFTGVAGKKVVFVPRNDFYLLGGFMNTDLEGSSWQVTESLDSTYAFAVGLFTVSHPSGA